jgi:hypothetical protein
MSAALKKIRAPRLSILRSSDFGGFDSVAAPVIFPVDLFKSGRISVD